MARFCPIHLSRETNPCQSGQKVEIRAVRPPCPKKLVADVLDRVDQFPDFDPRRHYALTLSVGELSVVEREAAALSGAVNGGPSPSRAGGIDLGLP